MSTLEDKITNPEWDIDSEIVSTLEYMGCTLVLEEGIYKVTTPAGIVWDFTQPQIVKG